MARANEARDWAQEHLRGIADSMITPFDGEHGDDIDFEAYRAIVRYALMAESVRVGMVLNDAMAKSAGPIGALAETFAAFVAEASAPTGEST